MVVLTRRSEIGKNAQEEFMSITARLQKVAQLIESRVNTKSFTFDVIFGRTLAMA